ncbi:MAG: isocitrate/isopropylmalate family dehydrogenase [Erysipelotrichales bacterium]
MKKITVIPGDGIGYEIMDGVLKILEAANVNLEYEIEHAGSDVFDKQGVLVPDSVFKSIETNKVALKGPITTPIGKGFKSINVMLRSKYDLYSNQRPCISYKGIDTKYSDIDLMFFRENTEGLYIGEEEIKETSDDIIATATKRITKKGSYRIIKKAFEYAKKHGYKKVTCVHKANILKLSDGLFLDTAREIKKDYQDIELEEVIVDNMCMQLVINPNQYNVIVTMNLYGDILSDLAAGLVGGLGIVPGANLGDEIAVFEAAHGSAPDIAGLNKANPLALLLSAVEMLDYLDMQDKANLIRESIEKTLLEKEFLTQDLGGKGSCEDFVERIIYNLGGN